MKKKICDKLISWRINNRLSQTEIAEKIGVSQSTYHKWESYKCDIPIKYFFKIASIIKMPFKEIIPKDFEDLFLEFPKIKDEVIHISAVEILKVIKQNNKLLKEKVEILEKQNYELKVRLDKKN